MADVAEEDNTKEDTNRPNRRSDVDTKEDAQRDNDSQLILENMDVNMEEQYIRHNSANSKANISESQCSVDALETPWLGTEEEEIPNKILPNLDRPKPTRNQGEQFQVDLMDHFNRIFEKKTFDSFKEFDDLFRKFKIETGSVFRIKSSCTVPYENSRRRQHFIPDRFKFVSIKYCCVHFGQPKVSGQGIRTKQRYLPCGCGCVLSVAYNRGALFISQVNMRHNHEVSNKIAPYYAMNRRISKNELKQVADVVAVMPNSRALQYFLKERFHRPMTLQDAKNTRARLKTLQLRQTHTENVKKSPSIKAIPQIHNNESIDRTILEIKEEKMDLKTSDDDYCCSAKSPNLQVEEKSKATEKNEAISELVVKFSDLMNFCDTNVFWERVAVMNKVLECWENGENLNIHYLTSEYNSDDIDFSSSKEENAKCVEGRSVVQENTRTLNNTANEAKHHCKVVHQDSADYQVKGLLPILRSTLQFPPASINGSSVKLILPQVEEKAIHKSDSITKRPRGRPRKKDGVCSQLKHTEESDGDVMCENNSQASDVGQVRETNYSSNNENYLSTGDSGDIYCGQPFISCITKDPCMDINEQALEVKIEINDADIP